MLETHGYMGRWQAKSGPVQNTRRGAAAAYFEQYPTQDECVVFGMSEHPSGFWLFTHEKGKHFNASEVMESV